MDRIAELEQSLQRYRPRGRKPAFASSGKPVRLVARAYKQTLRTPATYEAFEALLEKWIATVVTSRTIGRDGNPMHRERGLVKGNPSAKAVWKKIQHLAGKSTEVRAAYEFDENTRVTKITFTSPLPAPVREINMDPVQIRVTPKDSLKTRYPEWKKDRDKAKKHVKTIMAPVYDIAKRAKALVDNPIKPGIKKSMPKVTDLFKQVLGVLLEAARNGGAKEVARTRSKIYYAYSQGVAAALDPKHRVPRYQTEAFNKIVALGKSETLKLSRSERYELSIRLIDNARHRTGSLNNQYYPQAATQQYFDANWYGSVFAQGMGWETAQRPYLVD
jgi:hypothetical protein